MTRRANARVAGCAFLLYIALGIASMALFGAASGGEGIAEQLAAIARNEAQVRMAAVLTLLCGLSALVLGVTLWSLTRRQDEDIAMFGLVFRAAEGVVGGIAIQGSLGPLWLGTHLGTEGVDPVAAHALGAFVLGQTWSFNAAATFFAVGSVCFSWLMLRGRMVPLWLAWLGVVASVLLTAVLPLRLAGLLPGIVAQSAWAPMAVFEIVLAVWLITKGIEEPRAAEGHQPVA